MVHSDLRSDSSNEEVVCKQTEERVLSTVVLHQAAERTQLVIDCAGLVRRLENLDAEIAMYDQWQRYPTAEYKSKTQLRFEEARAREAAEAAKRGGGPHSIAGQLPLKSLQCSHAVSPRGMQTAVSPLPSPAKSQEHENKLAVAHLQRALRAADFEAEVWRTRANDMQMASERERDQAKRLMEFELSVALQDAEEKMEQEYKKMQADRDEHRDALLDARKELEDQRERLRYLEYAQNTKEADLAALRSQVVEARDSERAYHKNLKQIEQELRDMRTERETHRGALEASRSEEKRLVEIADARVAELSELRLDLEGARTHIAVQRHELEERVTELQEVRERQQALVLAAQRRAELLNAKCENLEAALESATAKQADAAMEREAHREQAQHLLKENDQLRLQLGEVRGGGVLHDATLKLLNFSQGVSVASTMASGAPTSSSGEGSPKSVSGRCSPSRFSQPLPPVRPPSATISPRSRRDLLAHRC